MVPINSFQDLRFKHFVDVPRCGCTFGSARDEKTGKSHLFLIFTRNQEGTIYKRDGLRGTWELLESKHTNYIRKLFNRANDVPHYSTQNLVNLN